MRAHLVPKFVLLAAVALASGGATECGQIIDDAGFDLWCDDRLCAWEVEKGETRRAATWHAKDAGVELVGDDVAISQFTPVRNQDGHCVRFELLADVEETAEVMLELDVYDDGSVDHQERLPTSNWRQLSYLRRMPTWYQGVRFRLTKRGGGRAVLANIGASIAPDAECPGEPIVIGPRPLGALCIGNDDCASALCEGDGLHPDGWPWPGTCASCVHDPECARDEVCARVGVNRGTLALVRQCVRRGSVPTGAACGADNNRGLECASGICLDGWCQGCTSDATCGGGTCGLTEHASEGVSWPGPLTCRGGGPGATCVGPADCASGVCAGAPLRLCVSSHRECEVETDCPTFGTDGEISCVTVGTRGGSCQ